MKENRGLFIVFTGDGKGKTTAALGMALRAAGHGMPVALVQCIKGPGCVGERQALERFGDLIDVHVMGRGFTWKSKDREMDRKAGQEAWRLAAELIASGRYQMVILDELTYLIRYGMVDEEEILATIRQRAPDLHVVVTGRHASEALMAAADMVTEMRGLRHPFGAGVVAQKGIEF